jgi:hypothetical protein
MINTGGNNWIPSPGFAYISNGEVWTDSIQLGANDRIENWHDTNENPPEPEEDVSDAEAVEILMGGAAP